MEGASDWLLNTPPNCTYDRKIISHKQGHSKSSEFGRVKNANSVI